MFRSYSMACFPWPYGGASQDLGAQDRLGPVAFDEIAGVNDQIV